MNYKQILPYILLFLALYFVALRPVRVFLQHQLVVPVATHLLSVPKVTIIPKNSPGMYVRWDRPKVESLSEANDISVERLERRNVDLFSFNGFGDKFFLFGALYFLAMGFGWKPVGWLFLLHQGITILSLICLFLAVSTHPAWLYPMNLLVTYLTPAATGILVLSWGKTRDAGS